jgi:predicted nuclease of predicted toxin-antitoxin system
MKLFFDHNLSYKLVGRLADLFPNSEHVRNVNLHAAEDRMVWEYTRANGFAIVSKDEDFHQLSFLYGAPPKVVWVRLGTSRKLHNDRHRTGFTASSDGLIEV